MDQESSVLMLKGMGIPLPEELLLKVVDFDPKGELNDQESIKDMDGDGAMYDGRHHLWLYETPDDAEDKTDPCYYDTIPQAWKDEIAGVEITPDMWVPPGAPEKLDREIIEFILSANPRFDKLKAYKTLVDQLLGVQLSVFDATTAYGGALDELDDTLRENMWGGIGTDTAAGRANRDALSGAVNDALALAEAFAAAGDNDKAAFTIATTRAELIKAGQAAGVAEDDMNAYLDTLGLTPWLVGVARELDP